VVKNVYHRESQKKTRQRKKAKEFSEDMELHLIAVLVYLKILYSKS
jgi:hypothetical protein